uniref:(northern house mosquito) hypothetical protein n=1 Tax=Culex pipiens TaxID=7175 RepID=A0A8D8GR31_CULPI
MLSQVNPNTFKLQFPKMLKPFAKSTSQRFSNLPRCTSSVSRHSPLHLISASSKTLTLGVCFRNPTRTGLSSEHPLIRNSTSPGPNAGHQLHTPTTGTCSKVILPTGSSAG